MLRELLQNWFKSKEEEKKAATFRDFATSIIQSDDLDSLDEPYAMVKEKADGSSGSTYRNWQSRVWDLVSNIVAGCPRRGKERLTSEQARRRINEAEGGLAHRLQTWATKVQTRQLTKARYNSLGVGTAKAIAWNLWLEKLMDHVRTVSHYEGIAAAGQAIVSRPVMFTRLRETKT